MEGFLVDPGLDGEVGLGVEAHSEYDDGEEAREVARELPVLPLPRLPWRRRRSVEEVAVWAILVAQRLGPSPPPPRRRRAGVRRRRRVPRALAKGFGDGIVLVET
ncbi:hypothetical protein RHGRI_010468 [Rhododendron griersonianum]|uniref:Uncharacterized protein n=1 Tax=Rhododendron griersonianum TaxID=479676 RepID=A0AAV6KJ27_9ERIC|nr:hypothetical protein RHGRI_010468 [Rhododendron griersonianum]